MRFRWIIWVQLLKYSHNFAIVSVLADALTACATSLPLPDALIPIPLHPNRLRQRGFNQAHEIARHIACNLHLPVMPHAATCILDMPPQASLLLKERRKNLRGPLPATAAFKAIASQSWMT